MYLEWKILNIEAMKKYDIKCSSLLSIGRFCFKYFIFTPIFNYKASGHV
ncbi:hypothetical protein B4083_5652 [Bacillus cereus]|nr:hypothetical protein B4083_5652 [Bacillus cereus]